MTHPCLFTLENIKEDKPMSLADETNKGAASISPADRFHVMKIIEANIEADGHMANGQRYIKYKEGWSDARVAEVSALRIAESTAQHIRQQTFGSLKRGGIPREFKERMEVMEKTIAVLQGRLTELENAITTPSPKSAAMKSFGDLGTAINGRSQ